MKLDTVLCKFNYNITGGEQFMWNCYPDARYMSLSSENAEVSVIYSTVDQTVYEATVDLAVGVEASGLSSYRWLDPEWKAAYEAEAKSRNCDPKIAYDDVEWVDLEVEDDFLSKARDMFDGKFDFDKRVQIDIDLPDDLILFIAKKAHELDITFNQYIAQILEHELPKMEEDIENGEFKGKILTKKGDFRRRSDKHD